MLDKEHEPDEAAMHTHMGDHSLWQDLRTYLESHYNFEPETVFGGAKYGWTVRYRRSGRTLTALLPEIGAFTALVVLGKKEVAKVDEFIDTLSAYTQDLYANARQLHDGKWLWIRVTSSDQVEDVKKLLAIKRKPKPPQ